MEKRNAGYGFALALAVLLAGCTSVSHEATDDPLAFLENAEMLSEGVCALSKNGRAATFNCRVFRVKALKHPAADGMLHPLRIQVGQNYLVIYDSLFINPQAVFLVHDDGRLALEWRKEFEDVPTHKGQVSVL